jgi:methyl-accepting chemotaxis protein
MKKLFAFLKSFFVKVDQLEDKVEKFVDESKFINEEQKKKIKKTLDKVDQVGENIEDVVVKAEVAHEKISKVVKSKNLVDATQAVDAVKDVVKEAKDLKEDAQAVAKKVKTIKKKN